MSDYVPFVAPEPEVLAPLFPNYAITSLIACGGMGAVYRAKQIALERDVAIKILPRELNRDASFRSGFAAEAKAMAKLNHPNLIGVYDFGEVEGMLFLVMEFVAGPSLHQVANGKAILVDETAKLMSAVCLGLAHAHENGILHRDIKPANILLDLQHNPKIGDFGLARPIGVTAKADEEIYGTPHYTAPEVVDNPRNVDARADIFSLGVVLHELLTGKLPAVDPRLPSVISGCPTAFDSIVHRATHPNPAFRYPDVSTMGRDLAETLKQVEAQASAGPKFRGMAKVPPPKAAVAAAAAHSAHRPAVRPATSAVRKSGPLKISNTGYKAVKKSYATRSSSDNNSGMWIVGAVIAVVVIIIMASSSGPEPTRSQAPAPSVATVPITPTVPKSQPVYTSNPSPTNSQTTQNTEPSVPEVTPFDPIPEPANEVAPAPTAELSQELRIVEARFGNPQQELWLDVTRKLRYMAARGSIDQIIERLTFDEDPAPGLPLRLEVSYELDGEARKITVKVGAPLTLKQGQIAENPVEDSNESEAETEKTSDDTSKKNTASAAPVDVDKFLERARIVMREKTLPVKNKRDEALRENLLTFEKRLNRKIRDIDDRDMRKDVEARTERRIRELERNGCRIPTIGMFNVPWVAGAQAIYDDFLGYQENIDGTYLAELSDYKQLYLRGLEAQILRMDTEKDEAVIEKLKSEIDLTKSDNSHFAKILEPNFQKLGNNTGKIP